MEDIFITIKGTTWTLIGGNSEFEGTTYYLNSKDETIKYTGQFLSLFILTKRQENKCLDS